MTITKNGVPIETIDDWGALAGPKRGLHWQDGRSAKEAARSWLGATSPRLPDEVEQALATHPAVGPVLEWRAEPEVRLRFDTRKGEPRNTDLLVDATDSRGAFIIAVEAKADERFSETVSQALAAALERRVSNARSRGVERIVELATALLTSAKEDKLPSVGKLRYQLLTATAGALAEGGRKGVDRVVLLVHEFRTSRTDDRLHDANSADLDLFVQRLSCRAVNAVPAGTIVGPFALPGGDALSHGPHLFIGKAVCNIRESPAPSIASAL